MWISAVAAMLVVVSSSQPGKLAVVNDRLTFGHLGPVRESPKYLPGDVVFLAFEVENMTFDAAGKASYAIGMEIADPSGKQLLSQKPREASTRNYLGGVKVPCAANIQVPLESAPGVYTFRVTVVDNATKQSVSVERKLEVLAKGFGLIMVGTSADPDATIAWSPVGIVGDSIYLNFSAVGFARDKNKQPNIQVSMRVLDDRGQLTNAAKMTGEAKSGVPENMAVVPMQFGITLNRAGHFTLELTATDVLTQSATKVSFPVRVVTP